MPRPVRVALPALTALAVAVLSGCSDSAEPAPPPSPAPASASASPSPLPPSASTPAAAPTSSVVAELEARARASVLTPEDLPGYDARPPQPDDPAEAQFERAFAECARIVPPEGAFAEAESADYERAEGEVKGQITSEAVVLPDLATAQSDLTALRAPSAAACLRKALVEQPDGPGPGVTVAPLKVPVPAGATGAYGFSVTIPSGTEPGSVPLRIERVGAVVGMVRLTLVTYSFGQPVPAAERDRLLASVVRRSAQAQR